MPLIGDAIRGFPDFGLDLRVTLQGFALALAVGFFAGFVPAMAAYRGRITEILRQV
jgi:hypothetical protein